MAFQAIIRYHCDLMSEYRTLERVEFATEDEAAKWLDKRMKEIIPEDDDPENPISDLYYNYIQEV